MHLIQAFCGITDSRCIAVQWNRYWTQFDRANTITLFKIWTHKWHPLPRHYRPDKGCPLWDFGENLPRYSESALYSQNGVPLFVWTKSVFVVADTFVLRVNKRCLNWIKYMVVLFTLFSQKVVIQAQMKVNISFWFLRNEISISH